MVLEQPHSSAGVIMTGTREDLTRRFVELAGRIRSGMARRRYAAEWSQFDLTMPQLRSLALLFTGPQRMSAIAEVLGTSLPATTSLIDRMVDKELVERVSDAADRRVVVCRLTPAGQREVERLHGISHARLDELVEVLTDPELAVVVDAFEIMASAVERLEHRRPTEHGAACSLRYVTAQQAD